ncbi:TetR family transcriptional regulator [Amycolatopsis antarctica]|uniref:TetR family transcriptional regulator n=1 Tax=Amycolatopsis antarctica TaxID=1854586 RepID=A0A263D2K4_9PSEU|nr:TetR/AcrR family transcriptional regulator [Amycolatopsis antarctica]OZM72702.1 TetR family transcriptional regulator [Amycolatopsis antarctica]
MDRSADKRRGRETTEQDIRRTARTLLVEHGHEAVTLRAIARELGITAPALYRYYGSHEDLIAHLRVDVVNDLGERLAAEIAELPDDGAVQFFALCRGFRRWALTHTREFTLVFASPTGSVGSAAGSVATLRGVQEPFGRTFLTSAGQVLATHELATPADDTVPAVLREDLARCRDELAAVLASSGSVLPPARLDLGTTYLMIRFWSSLYGHVSLEVFGNYPIPLSDPDAVFDALLADLSREIGLPVPADTQGATSGNLR